MMTLNLASYKLETPLPNAFLIPNFITCKEEAYLLTKIEEIGGVEIDDLASGTSRSFQSKATPSGWKSVKGRRLMEWGGSLLGKVLVQKPLPDFIQKSYPFIMNRVQETTNLFPIGKSLNHVLVNEYLPGQGIMPHEDGSAYFPTVTTLSLGSHTILDLYQYEAPQNSDVEGGKSINSDPFCSVFIPARSLFIMSDNLYKNCLHGISDRVTDTKAHLDRCVNISESSLDMDRMRRVSLTMRCVEKTRKLF